MESSGVAGVVDGALFFQPNFRPRSAATPLIGRWLNATDVVGQYGLGYKNTYTARLVSYLNDERRAVRPFDHPSAALTSL